MKKKKIFELTLSQDEIDQAFYNIYEKNILDQLNALPMEKFTEAFTTIIQQKFTPMMEPEGEVNQEINHFKTNAFTVQGLNAKALKQKIMKKLAVMEASMMDTVMHKPSYSIYILGVEDKEKFFIFMESNIPNQKHLLGKCLETHFFSRFSHCPCNPIKKEQ